MSSPASSPAACNVRYWAGYIVDSDSGAQASSVVVGARIINTWPVMYYYSGREGMNWSETHWRGEWAVGT
jgi:hypothetical protein